MLSLLFLSVTRFSHLCEKIIMTQEVLITGEISFEMGFKYLFLEPNQKSKVDLFWNNSEQLLAFNFFLKKFPS